MKFSCPRITSSNKGAEGTLSLMQSSRPSFSQKFHFSFLCVYSWSTIITTNCYCALKSPWHPNYILPHRRNNRLYPSWDFQYLAMKQGWRAPGDPWVRISRVKPWLLLFAKLSQFFWVMPSINGDDNGASWWYMATVRVRGGLWLPVRDQTSIS